MLVFQGVMFSQSLETTIFRRLLLGNQRDNGKEPFEDVFPSKKW